MREACSAFNPALVSDARIQAWSSPTIQRQMRRDVFQAIADPVRRDIIEMLAQEPWTVNEIAARFDISRPAISRHLKVLGECGLVEFEEKGRKRYCRLAPASLVPAFLWLEKYQALWEERLDAFGTYLNELKSKQEKNESE